jgi:chromosome segregation ATPase
MSTSAENVNVQESQEEYQVEASPTPRWIYAVLLLLVGGVGWLLYAGYQTRQMMETEFKKANDRSDLLAKQLEQSNARIADLQGEVRVTGEKLGLTQEELGRARSFAANIQKEQKAAASQLASQIGEARKESEAGIGKVASDVGGAKADIEATKKNLESTIGQLQRSMGDMNVMSGLIARNREDLEDLKRRGERNIFEFDLRKSNQPARVGPIMVRLKKVDQKKNRYTMDVIADDKTIEKKDKTLAEPIQFYVGRARPPFEIIVFELGKDRAVGYLSTPKEAAQTKN